MLDHRKPSIAIAVRFNLKERVTSSDARDPHAAAQLIERIGWAVADAEDVELQQAARPEEPGRTEWQHSKAAPGMGWPESSTKPLARWWMRLSRPHASGGDVIARAAILAKGGDAAAIVACTIAARRRRRQRCRERRRVGPRWRRVDGDPAASRVIPRRYMLPARA